VCAAFGQVQHSAVLRGQLCGEPFAVPRRRSPEIEHYIEHGSPGAPDQLGLQRGVLPGMHAADRPSTRAETHVRPDWHEVDPVLEKLARAPRPQEPSTIILMRSRINDPCAEDIGLRETPAITILRPVQYFQVLVPPTRTAPAVFFVNAGLKLRMSCFLPHPLRRRHCHRPPLSPAIFPANMDTSPSDRACGTGCIVPDTRPNPG